MYRLVDGKYEFHRVVDVEKKDESGVPIVEDGKVVLTKGEEFVHSDAQVAIVYSVELKTPITHGTPESMTAWLETHHADEKAHPMDVLILDGISAEDVNAAIEDPDTFRTLLDRSLVGS